MDLDRWAGVPVPRAQPLDGRYVRVEPLDVDAHTSSLYEASVADGAEERFRYLPERPPADLEECRRWVQRVLTSTDPLFFAVLNKESGQADGRQALMRTDAANGVVEVGNIMWGPRLARTRGATEALFLFADYVFGLGYRRFEWKCNNLNEPSKRAAARFGFAFEGVFRQHMVVKGRNRDTAWFAMVDTEWPRLHEIYTSWLDPTNFDADGRQLTRSRPDTRGTMQHALEEDFHGDRLPRRR